MQIMVSQMALFFKDIIRNPLRYGDSIASHFKELKDVVPASSGTVLVLNQKNNEFKCFINFMVSGERIDFIVQYTNKEENESSKKFFIDFSEKLIEYVCKGKSFSRIGLISSLFIEESNPVKFIKNKFSIKNIDDDIFEFSIRQNKHSTYKNVNTNNIYVNEAAFNQNIYGETKTGIFINHDINTFFIEDGLSYTYLNDFFVNNVEKLFHE